MHEAQPPGVPAGPERVARIAVLAPRFASAAVLAVVVAGVAFACLQEVDPTPQWTYFSVDTAVLTGVGSVLRLVQRHPGRLAESARGAGTLGSLVAGTIWVVALAPAGVFPASLGAAANASNALLHVALPVLATAVLLAEPDTVAGQAQEVAAWLIWPAGYIGAIWLLAGTGLIKIPYAFLDPGAVGLWSVTLATGGSLALAFTLAALLVAAGRLRGHWGPEAHGPRAE